MSDRLNPLLRIRRYESYHPYYLLSSLCDDDPLLKVYVKERA